MNDHEIRITVDGKLALTTSQFAAEAGVDPATVRGEIRDLVDEEGQRIRPIAHLDARTPLYAAVPLRKAWKARPGKAWRAGTGKRAGSRRHTTGGRA